MASVSRETQERLEEYVALVAKWTKTISLISRRDRKEIWERHVEDSLRLLPHIPSCARSGVDLGSGAGFPGLVVALATGIPFALVESDRRKAAFLIEAQRVTGAPVEVHCQRILDLVGVLGDIVTARALAPLPALLGYVAHVLRPGGTALLQKGGQVAHEIAEAEVCWSMDLTSFSDARTPGAHILAVRNLRRAMS